MTVSLGHVVFTAYSSLIQLVAAAKALEGVWKEQGEEREGAGAGRYNVVMSTEKGAGGAGIEEGAKSISRAGSGSGAVARVGTGEKVGVKVE